MYLCTFKRNLLISVVLLEAIHSLRLQAEGSRKLLSSNIKHNVAKLMIHDRLLRVYRQA